jgi:hypothetical protein
VAGADWSDAERRAAQRYVGRVAGALGVDDTLDLAPSQAAASGSTADLVVWGIETHRTADWPEGLRAAAARAKRALVVVVRNAERLGANGEAFGTLEIAPVLWGLGRVRDHAYLALPKALGAALSVRFAFAPTDVLHAPVPALVRRTARLHGFVVDITPRTPQARRRLRALGGPGGL